MVDQDKTDRNTARKLLFELQSLIGIADKAGINTVPTKELLRKASVASRIETPDGLKEMIKYLNEGRASLDITMFDYFNRQLTEMRKEIEEKKANIPQGHSILTSYNIAVHALKNREFENTLKNTRICRNELDKVTSTGIMGEYSKYQTKEPIPCYSCGGNVLPGYTVLKCVCGKTYHNTCAIMETMCKCGQRFTFKGEEVMPSVNKA